MSLQKLDWWCTYWSWTSQWSIFRSKPVLSDSFFIHFLGFHFWILAWSFLIHMFFYLSFSVLNSVWMYPAPFLGTTEGIHTSTHSLLCQLWKPQLEPITLVVMRWRQPKQLIIDCHLEVGDKSNGNRTKWSPIRSVIIRVRTKSEDRAAGFRFVYHETKLDDAKSYYQLIIKKIKLQFLRKEE